MIKKMEKVKKEIKETNLPGLCRERSCGTLQGHASKRKIKTRIRKLQNFEITLLRLDHQMIQGKETKLKSHGIK